MIFFGHCVLILGGLQVTQGCFLKWLLVGSGCGSRGLHHSSAESGPHCLQSTVANSLLRAATQHTYLDDSHEDHDEDK